MKFVKKTNVTGVLIHLDLENLKLPVPEGLDLEPLLDFKSKTYSPINRKGDKDGFEIVFGLVHKFINGLSEKEQINYAATLVMCNYKILSVLGVKDDSEDKWTEDPNFGNTLLKLENELNDLINELDISIDLFNKLRAFAEQNIKLPDMTGVGERGQDSKEMTFYADELYGLAAISLLGKLLCPVFAQFIEHAKRYISSDLKELHCVVLLKSVLNNRCAVLNQKLLHYITKIAGAPKETEYSKTYNGFTATMLVQRAYAQVMIKRLVTLNISEEESNIIKYVYVCVRSVASNGVGGSGKPTIKPLAMPDDAGGLGGDGDGNTSNLEAESNVSSKTADCPIIIAEAVRQCRESFILDAELDINDLISLEDYYKAYHIVLTPINSYLCGLLFGNYILGAKSVELLDYDSLVTLVSLMQLWMIKNGYNDLVLLVSALPTDNNKSRPVGEDATLVSNYKNSYEYSNCCDRFNLIFDKLSWDNGLVEIVKEITGKVYLYNAAPKVWEMLGQENRNNNPVVTPVTTARSICSIALEV